MLTELGVGRIVVVILANDELLQKSTLSCEPRQQVEKPAQCGLICMRLNEQAI